MKRDDELLRRILIDTEAQNDWLIFVSRAMNQSQQDREFGYHVELLSDAGLMTKVPDSGYRMTNQGHDYLEAIRSDTVWNKTKQGAAQVGGMTLGMMKDLAIAYFKQEVAGKLGINF